MNAGDFASGASTTARLCAENLTSCDAAGRTKKTRIRRSGRDPRRLLRVALSPPPLISVAQVTAWRIGGVIATCAFSVSRPACAIADPGARRSQDRFVARQ
jgi:hypothetical protein